MDNSKLTKIVAYSALVIALIALIITISLLVIYLTN